MRAKELLRTLRPTKLITESSQTTAEATAQITAAIKKAQGAMDAGTRAKKIAAAQIGELLSDVVQLSKDAGESLDHLIDDLGRSGTDPRCTALDKLQDSLSDAESELQDAYKALGIQGRVVKPNKTAFRLGGPPSLRTVRQQARSVMKELRKAEIAARDAEDALDASVSSTDNADVYYKFEHTFEKLSADLTDAAEDCHQAQDRLESV